MDKGKVIKIIKIVVTIVLIFTFVSVFRSCQRIGDYKVTKLYEDLTLSEKVAAFLNNTHFNTKEESIEKGLIFSDIKQEAQNIGDIFIPITTYIGTNDGENTQIKIDKCNEVLEKLHKENESGKLINNDLVSLMNNCISTVENYQYALKAHQDLNATQYKSYSDKLVESYRNATNDLERLNKQ